MIKLTGTTACTMRDKLVSCWLNKDIKLSEITDRLTKIEIPDWLESQILQMVHYRQLDRCTCPVEQAMFQAVCNKIVDKLMKEEQLKT